VNETHDELAGVVDLFGALTRQELTTALTELAFKRGQEPDEDAVVTTIEDASEAYALVPVDPGSLDDGVIDEGQSETRTVHDSPCEGEGVNGEQFLVPGPTAFPSLPPAAEDLPHIMDVPRRTIDREAVGEVVLSQLEAAAERAREEEDPDRAEQLLDVSYDLEAWAPVEADGVRQKLDELLEERE
jgi:hypothetical protein